MNGKWQPIDCDVLAVPLFPLPNMVLFPRAVLPLHIFEDRYKIMTAQALTGNRLIAMTMLRPGWEKNYYSKPEFEPVVCVGKILSAEKLQDGKYNFLLEGQLRATVVAEIPSSPYRTVEVKPMPESDVLEIDLANFRQRLAEMLCHGPMASTPMGAQLKKIMDSSMPTRDVADLIAYYLLEDARLKQTLLADPDVIRRVKRLITALTGVLPVLERAGGARRAVKNLN